MANDGVVSNPTNNPVLAQGSTLSQSVVDWSSAISQSATNILGVLNAWNNAKATKIVEAPVGVNNTQQDTVDNKLQKGFFYAGIAMIFIAGGIYLYKRI